MTRCSVGMRQTRDADFGVGMTVPLLLCMPADGILPVIHANMGQEAEHSPDKQDGDMCVHPGHTGWNIAKQHIRCN